MDCGFRKSKIGFIRFVEERSLIFSVCTRKIAFQINGDVLDKNAFIVDFDVLYPGGDRWASIIPDAFFSLRRDGSLRWVDYSCESDGIFLKTENEVIIDLLSAYLDLWMDRLTDPHEGIKLLSWLRGETDDIPDYANYMKNFVEDDVRNNKYYFLKKEASVRIGDGAERQYRYYAYLNAAGDFDWVRKDSWVANCIPGGKKLVDDAKNRYVEVPKSELRRIGLM